MGFVYWACNDGKNQDSPQTVLYFVEKFSNF